MALNTAALRLLVVEDDDDFRDSLMALLRKEQHEVIGVADLETARRLLTTRDFDAILVDQELPDGDGTTLLGDPCRPPMTQVVVITGYATVALAVAALQRGAVDYLTKPTDFALLQATLLRLSGRRALSREIESLREALDRAGLGPLIGRSTAMNAVFDSIQRVAPTEANVLILGESGTGKEMVALAIHQLSDRREAPLIVVNCGAIPEQLIESELFGHEKGAFTGAHCQHRGVFERADGGTLFLDEITEMPLQVQVRLLRIVESGVVQRVGGTKPVQTDVRVLAATNREPRTALAEGKLREDLYFRLAGFPIRLPPLRERGGDIELLSQYFLDQHNRTNGTHKHWRPGALALLARESWRGNVRELRNGVRRAYILADEGALAAVDAIDEAARSIRPRNAGTLTVQVGSSIAECERVLIEATLEHVGGDKAAAARVLGFSLKTLYSRLSVYAAAEA